MTTNKNFRALAREWGVRAEAHDSIADVVEAVLYAVLERAQDVLGQPEPTAPPEPPLRVGDWVRWPNGSEGQMLDVDRGFRFSATRIEPPVGWPVAVLDPDAPGGVRWWVKGGERYYRTGELWMVGVALSWPDLVAAGGVPALPPGGAA